MTLMNFKARVQFDYGARSLLVDELKRLNCARPLLVSDRGIVKSGVLDAVLAQLAGRLDFVVFDEVAPNPNVHGVEAALVLYRETERDSVVAVGGGSVINTGKCLSLMATNPGNLGDYCGSPEAASRLANRSAPTIAIPTTAGTGSEVGRGIGISLEHGKPKAVLRHDYLIPDVAICDPELTFAMPAWLTAGTGIDAFAHCLEGYLSHQVNPPLDAIAIDGMARVAKYLPQVIDNSSDRHARWEVLMGAVQGGMSIVKGLGPAHAVSIPIDTLDLHHGTVVGVVLPEAIRFLLPEVHSKLERVASKLKLQSAEEIPGFIAALNRRIGLPEKLSSLGLSEKYVSDFAASAAGNSFNQTSPRRGSVADYAEILSRCL
jgi:4-hydroxybutyrate dehydrogenase